MPIYVEEPELKDLELSMFHEIRLISYPEDSTGILTLSWPSPGNLERSVLRVLVREPEDPETLPRVSGLIVSLRNKRKF